MGEFQDVMKQFDRMCWYYQRKRKCPMACPMNGVNISQCRKVAFEEPKETEEIVMAWAAEHPVVYPTWVEWLVDSGVFPQKMSTIPSVAFNTIRDSLSVEIPADIAQKLGIKPKEG